MKPQTPVKVININRNGEVFNPAEYVVRRDEHPEVYKCLEAIFNGQRKNG